MALLNRIHTAKDKALGLSFKALLNERFAKYGTALECAVDTRMRRVVVTALLDGESVPTVITLEDYALDDVDGTTYLALGSFTGSRPWVATLLADLLGGQRLRLPYGIRKLL